MTTTAVETKQVGRRSRIDARKLRQPAVLIFIPDAGHELGVDTNSGGSAQVQEALYNEGITFVARRTERAGQATDLARQPAAEGRELVIAAGGDGTVNEVAHGRARGRAGRT